MEENVFLNMVKNDQVPKNIIVSLLKDHTTNKNIVWATEMYSKYGKEYGKDKQMFSNGDFSLLKNNILVPRLLKTKEEQAERTKNKGEVFTPTFIINQMNNYCDEQWFKKNNVFNIENDDNTWTVIQEKIQFDSPKEWKNYVDSKRLEITCGEAPYLVSRYDATTGNMIKLNDRIGILDRKMRIVSENTNNDRTWLQWTYRAFESVYGYEYQGDSLLLARINLVESFIDYYYNHFNYYPNIKIIKKIVDIVSWNIWQMDGLKNNSPSGIPQDTYVQLTLDDVLTPKESDNNESFCIIKDWRNNKNIEYRKITKGDDKNEV